MTSLLKHSVALSIDCRFLLKIICGSNTFLMMTNCCELSKLGQKTTKFWLSDNFQKTSFNWFYSSVLNTWLGEHFVLTTFFWQLFEIDSLFSKIDHYFCSLMFKNNFTHIKFLAKHIPVFCWMWNTVLKKWGHTNVSICLQSWTRSR